MPSSPRVIVSHPSKQGTVYERPLAAQRAGLPTLFLTGLYYRPGAFPYNLTALLPSGAKARALSFLQRRRIEGLDDSSIVSIGGPWLEIATRPGRLFGRLTSPFIPLQDSIHDLMASRWIGNLASGPENVIVHGFQGSCLRSLRAARRRGFLTALEITLPPCQWKIVGEERQRLGLKPGKMEAPAREIAEIREADYVISQSYFSMDCARQLGVEANRMIHLPMGGDVHRFQPPSPPRDASRPLQVLFLGQISIRKGIHYLLQAWHELRLPSARLLLVGSLTDPDAAPFLKKYEGEFSWLGFAPHSELARIYRESDIFVLPSLAEGGGNVLYEAMASGLPCIVTRNAGSAIVDGAEGRVIPVGDIPALKDAILELHSDRAKCRVMGEQAFLKAQRFTWGDYSRRIGKMYSRISESKGAPFSSMLDLVNE